MISLKNITGNMALPAVLVLVLLLTSVLAGCGSGRTDTETRSGTGGRDGCYKCRRRFCLCCRHA